MDAKKVSAHIFLSGRVQGVAFRYWTKRVAQGLQLTGWVRNTEDGKVELVAEGEKEKLNKFIEILKKGPMLSRVDKMEFDWEKDTEEFDEFRIVK